MATIASIASRRQRAIERIGKSLNITIRPVKAAPEFRHAAELEQIADAVDPAGAQPQPDAASAVFAAADGPPPSHEEAIAAAQPDVVAEHQPPTESEIPNEREEDHRRNDRPGDAEPAVQGGGRPAPAARGDGGEHSRHGRRR